MGRDGGLSHTLEIWFTSLISIAGALWSNLQIYFHLILVDSLCDCYEFLEEAKSRLGCSTVRLMKRRRRRRREDLPRLYERAWKTRSGDLPEAIELWVEITAGGVHPWKIWHLPSMSFLWGLGIILVRCVSDRWAVPQRRWRGRFGPLNCSLGIIVVGASSS